MHLRLPSTLTLLTLGPLMQLTAAAEAWHALALGGLLLAASCLGRKTPPRPEPEPEVTMNQAPTGRARSKFRGRGSWVTPTRFSQPQAVGGQGWGRVEDWFQ